MRNATRSRYVRHRFPSHDEKRGRVAVRGYLSMAVSLWANNHGGDAGDSVADVRRFRNEDRDASDARFERVLATPASGRSEDEIADDLMAALGLEA